MPTKTTRNKALSRTFVSQYTYTPSKPKKFSEPSQTQPGMAHTIKDIMNRAEQGLPIPSSYGLAQYGDDADFIGLEPGMDLVEKHEIIANAKRELKQKEINIESKPEEKDEKGGTTQEENSPAKAE